jgi:uncharacterized membrane protein YjdF
MNRSHWWIIAFNALYLIAFAVYYTSIGNYEFLIYISVIALLGLIIGVNLKKSNLDNLVLWLLSIWGLVHMIGGGIRIAGNTIYSMRLIDIVDKGGQFYILKMDQVIHFYGFFVAAILVYQLLKTTGSIAPKSAKLMIFLSWIGSMGLGALNEVIEFIAFIALAETGVGDLYNTGLDLIFNMAGALVGAFLAHKIYKKG